MPNHYQDTYCSDSVDNVKCTEKCRKQLECGHECLNECYKCQDLSKPHEEPENEETKDETKEETKEETKIIVPIERTQHEKFKSQVSDMIINTFEAAVSSLYQAKLAQEDSVNDLVENLLNFQISDDSSSSFDHSLPYVNALKSTPSETFQETLSQMKMKMS
ncbi:unnamed protein product [Rhizophagus irregularis]|nr:unnamed protein product [Rhizophagus irregularis]